MLLQPGYGPVTKHSLSVFGPDLSEIAGAANVRFKPEFRACMRWGDELEFGPYEPGKV